MPVNELPLTSPDVQLRAVSNDEEGPWARPTALMETAAPHGANGLHPSRSTLRQQHGSQLQSQRGVEAQPSLEASTAASATSNFGTTATTASTMNHPSPTPTARAASTSAIHTDTRTPPSKLRDWFSGASGATGGKRLKRKQEGEAWNSIQRGSPPIKTLFSRRASSSSPASSSSKQKQKDLAFTPRLPPELWVLVFQFAGATSHPFLDPDLPTPDVPLSFLDLPDSNNSRSVSSFYSGYGQSGPQSRRAQGASSGASSSSSSYDNHYRYDGYSETGRRRKGADDKFSLLMDYKRSMKIKATITLVCRLWYAVGQEVLYEFVWISRGREARWLADVLGRRGIGGSGVEQGRGKGKGKCKASAAEGGRLPLNPDQTPGAGTYTYPYDARGVGRHIRRLHIETGSLDRCSPGDLLRILEHAPLLQVYSDYGGIRRTTGFRVFVRGGGGGISGEGRPRDEEHREGEDRGISRPGPSVSTATITTSSRGSTAAATSTGVGSVFMTSATSTSTFQSLHPPQQESDRLVLSALLAPPDRTTTLRRLSYTNYEYEPGDYEGGVRYYMRVVGPKLERAREGLEFLELTLCKRERGGGFLGAGSVGFADPGTPTVATVPSLVNVNNLTSLTASLTSTVTTTITSSLPPSLSSASSLSTRLSSETLNYMSASPLCLPALLSLKVTLDNTTFHVLSTWDMPALQNLSVVSADFSYAGPGFARFFEVHGGKILELELGHSTGAIQQFWLTNPGGGWGGVGNDNDIGGANGAVAVGDAGAGPSTGWTFGQTRVPLAEWCPNLARFICSADAEWNWESPDWIAPHVLLPTHAGLQFIGIRDMEKRVLEALERVEHRDFELVVEGQGFRGLDDRPDRGGESVNGPDPFFMLLEQIGSLLRKEAFPSLAFVRDLSFGSGLMRRSGRIRTRGGSRLWDESVDGEKEALDGRYRRERGREEDSDGRRLIPPSPRNIFASVLIPKSLRTVLQREHEGSRNQQRGVDKIPGGLTLKELQERQQGLRLLRFWVKVVEKCKNSGVCLEDCDGYRVTYGVLQNVAATGSL